MYNVTIRFISGNLAGLTITQVWSWEPKVGAVCASPYGGTSGYVIERVTKQI